jgi:multidrug efflux system membrane fusion protein
VLSGLAAGDVVVTEGADRLRDGATVVLPEPTAPAGAAGGAGAASSRAGIAH